MSSQFKVKSLLGKSYANGNVVFMPDGTTLLSPVGNRVVVMDIQKHNSTVLDLEARSDISILSLTKDGKMLIIIDKDGYALVVNMINRILVGRFNFKGKVTDAKFSPDGELLAIATGRSIELWRTPSVHTQFSAFSLYRTFTVHHDDVTTLDWSPSGDFLLSGSSDMTSRIFSVENLEGYVPVSLLGHRDKIVGAYFAADDTIYTVARDGAVFIWAWQVDTVDTVIPVPKKAKLATSTSALATKLRHSVPGSGANKALLGQWSLLTKHYVRQDLGHAQVSSSSLHVTRGILVLGMSSGTFSIFSLPSLQTLHNLSLGQHALSSLQINAAGDWIALGSAEKAQLVVWEWTSESYAIKQQGHAGLVEVTAFSPSGGLVATGSSDGKVKLWNEQGFCFVTFSDHTSKVTGLSFVGGKKGRGLSVLSCSLDGTVRAYDLMRYRNFRTMRAENASNSGHSADSADSASSVPFTAVLADDEGEIVAAACMDPFHVCLFSLKTGKLLDTLSGHTGPVSSLAFSPLTSVLASGSWDGTVRLWSPFSGGTPETIGFGAEVLGLDFRPDGKELAVVTRSGQLRFWDTERGVEKSPIDLSRDLSHLDVAARSSKGTNGNKSQSLAQQSYATSVRYGADGHSVTVGGSGPFVCTYALPSRVLQRRFAVSHSRALTGTQGLLNSRNEGEIDDAFYDDLSKDAQARAALPGVKDGAYGLSHRSKERVAFVKGLSVAADGAAIALSTPDGVLVYRRGQTDYFDPAELGEDITVSAAERALERGQFARALLLASQLRSPKIALRSLLAAPPSLARAVLQMLPPRFAPALLATIADALEFTQPSAVHAESLLRWLSCLLSVFQDPFRSGNFGVESNGKVELQRAQRALLAHKDSLVAIADENRFLLEYIAQ